MIYCQKQKIINTPGGAGAKQKTTREPADVGAPGANLEIIGERLDWKGAGAKSSAQGEILNLVCLEEDWCYSDASYNSDDSEYINDKV